jgi:MtfA peptidase
MFLNGAWQWRYLPNHLKDNAMDWCKVFVSEKNWEGCGGFRMSKTAQWTVASQAALLVLAYPDWYFDLTQSILIYPEAYVAPGPIQDIGNGIQIMGQTSRDGEAWYRGPVILNWNEVWSASHSFNQGNHLVVHELSHQLDMLNGRHVDGVPPLSNEMDVKIWQASWNEQLEIARDQVASGEDVLVNDYGLTSPAEFFAVSSELFTQVPHELSFYHATLFEMLLSFYKTDFRAWLPRID